jgi:lipoprotein-anchoring transpeptidase ErfK/SrfK
MMARFYMAVTLTIAAGAAAWPSSILVRPAAPRSATVPTQVAPISDARLPVGQQQLSRAYASGAVKGNVKSLLKIDRKLRYGEFVWNDDGVADGPTWIRVDLRSQLISIFRSGEEIGTAVILYGAVEKATPPGEFSILAKMRDHTSSLYDAKMPFTLRLTHDGISIHGSDVRWGAATHGCVGVPLGFAEKLFDAAKVGDPVLVVS